MSNSEEIKQEGMIESEQTEEQKKEEELFAKLSQIKYLGLSNQGATCYMNSLLQSLYMTYQFRQKLYQWKYDPKSHNKEEDCLPLQLQILFARLQECGNRSFIDTKPLINTFGWSNNQMFQQQDVQEFCRVLFDAIEKSFDHHKESEWIRDLYEGQTENFVTCKQCKSDSIRNDKFLDLQLIIKSNYEEDSLVQKMHSSSFVKLKYQLYQKVNNDSIEKCMKHFVKSVELKDDNQYFCEICNTKVDATKGVRFKTLPPVLMLQLNRFDLDIETFTRKKICDRVYFPHILNMNEFFKKYEEIVVEDPPKPNQSEQKGYDQSSSTRSKILSKRKASFDESSGQDCKPLFEDDVVQTKKFGSQQGDQEGQKESNNFLDSLQGNKQIQGKKKQMNPALFTRADEAYNYEENLFNAVDDFHNFALFSDIPDTKPEQKKQKLYDQQKQEGYAKKNVKIQKGTGNIQADEIYDIEGFKNKDSDQGFSEEKYDDNVDENEIDWSTTVPARKTEDDMIKKFRETNQKRDAERNKEILKENIEGNKNNHELISKYLKDGPYVYELYAVNVHSGGALGGHYFSYIKSFESGLWYNFNDSSVSKIRPSSLEYVYGQENPKSNQNTSAYMLMYRQVGLEDQKEIKAPEVPEQIKKLLQEEMIQEKKRLEEQQRLQKLRERQIDLRIYKNQEESSIFTFDKYVTTLEEVKLKVMEKYEIKEDFSNWRLRAYSSYEKIMQETFSGQLTIPIIDLNLKDSKDLIVEFKQEGEEFEEYDPSKINVNIYLWEESVGLIENFGVRLTPNQKLFIKDTETLGQLIEILAKNFEIPKDELIILKRTNRSSNFKIMLLNDVESTSSNTLKQLDIYNNIDIYVERKSDSRTSSQSKNDKDKKFAWEVQIEKESHSCTISFNNPKNNSKKGYSENNLEITIDNRCTLRDAKNLISKKINLSVDKFIMKRNTLTNADELKDLSIKLHNLSMIHRGNLFLSEGVPQSIDEFLIDYRICRKFDDSHSLIANYESEHLIYMPTRTSMTVLELKEVLVGKLKELRNIDVKSPKHLRFQERYTEYKTVMKNDKTLREYQLYDKKVIGITILDKEEDIKNDEILIFIKFWDWKTKEILGTVELIMKTYYDSKDFMQMVATYYDMNPHDIEVFFIQSIKNLSLEGIAYEINNWKSAFDDTFTISLFPWFLSRDAETFIVRDRNLFQENKQEIQEYLKGNTPDTMLDQNKSKYNDPNAQTDVKGKLQYKPMETALKINLKKKVVQNEDEEAQKSEEKKDNDDDGKNIEQPEQQKSDDKQTEQNQNEKEQENGKTNEGASNNNDKQEEKSDQIDNENKDQNIEKVEVQSYPPTYSQSTSQKQNSYAKVSNYPPKNRLVRFDEEFNQDFLEDEDAIMQQILLQSLQEFQNNPQNSDKKE